MRDILYRYHEIIDYVSVKVFLYSVFVLLGIKFFSSINNEKFYVSLILICPMFLCNKKLVQCFNRLLHRIFRFRR